MLRSIAAIIAGFLYIGALSFGADAVLRRVVPGAFGSAGQALDTGTLLLSQLLIGIFAISGCYLAARWAGRAPMRHALILGGLGLVFNIAGAVALWDTAPAWYHALALALVMPYAWLGGYLRERELARAGESLLPRAQSPA